MSSVVPFDYLSHALAIPVTVAGVETRFIFDTGIGINLISESLAAKVGCRPDGSTFTGRRMSGQPVTVPLGSLSCLQVGAYQEQDVPAGIFDMHAMAGLKDVEGFVSLSYFLTVPVTVDYRAGQLIVEDETSLADRIAAGTPVPVQVHRDGCSTDVMLGLDLPDGQSISAEVDTGSDVLILNETFAGAAGIDLQDEKVEKITGTDETGNEFVRYFTEARGDFSVTGAAAFRMTSPRVHLQRIIYDGLVGDRFLRNFTTTYDLPHSRMIFAAAVR